ncbi:23897_t:CDS:1, partial [Racocetra persica]
ITPTSENLMPVITPTSENLMSNQRHLLLFNINEPLEILLQEFDYDWWPLISNV